MKSSEKLDLIAAALSEFQGEVDSATKDGENPHFKSTFATLASYMEAAGPILAKHGLSISQTSGVLDGKPTLVTTLLHKSGQWMAGEYLLHPAKLDPQGVGAAMTYARRYCYAAILGMVAEDDDGEAAQGRGKAPAQTTNGNGANKTAQKVGSFDEF